MLTRPSRAAHLALALIAGLPACGGDGGGPTPARLTVLSVDPAPGATSADPVAPLVLTFDHALDPTTVSAAAVPLLAGAETLTTAVSYNPAGASLQLTAPLLPGEGIHAVVLRSLHGANDEQLAQPYAWSFSTQQWQAAPVGVISGTPATALRADAAGALHLLLFRAIPGGGDSLRYGRCAAACGLAASWAFTSLDSVGAGGPADLQVDASGALVIAYQNASTAELRFGRCLGGCANAAAWQFATLGASEGHTLVRVLSDPAGGYDLFTGAYIAGQIQLRYLRCDASCLTPVSWSGIIIDAHNLYGNGGAVRSADGALHLLYEAQDPVSTIRYATCSTACLTPGNWSTADLGASTGGGVALWLDPASELHGAASALGTVNHLHCSTGCLTPAAWLSTPVADYGSTVPQVAFAEGPGARFHIAFTDDDLPSLTYATCLTACDTPAGWRHTTVLQGTQGRRPSLAVDGSGDPVLLVDNLASGMVEVAR